MENYLQNHTYSCCHRLEGSLPEQGSKTCGHATEVQLSLLTDQPEFPCDTGQSEHQQQNITTRAAKERLGISTVTISKFP